MNKFIYLPLLFVMLACQSFPSKRGPGSTPNTELDLDPKFEEFEGGSFENEKAINDELIKSAKEMMLNVQRTNPSGVVTRDAHAKTHGCLKAEFQVHNEALSAQHRVGIFAENKSYDAWVRFSNNDQLPIRKDNEFDLRGMSIKVMNVQGKKIMEGLEQAPTQDFLMYGSNVFFIKDNKDYIGFIKGLRDGNAATVLLTQQTEAAIHTFYAQWKVSGFTNPANMPYHSAVPVRLGLLEDENRTAMKYRAIPCDQKHPYPSPNSKSDTNYFRENLKSTLSQQRICYNFQVQLQTDPKVMPIEDSRVAWPEQASILSPRGFSPYVTVAEITIPQQNFDTPLRDQYCEGLSLSPWHALVEHKPLGRTMRMRRDLYKATSEFRRKINGTLAPEPWQFDIE